MEQMNVMVQMAVVNYQKEADQGTDVVIGLVLVILGHPLDPRA